MNTQFNAEVKIPGITAATRAADATYAANEELLTRANAMFPSTNAAPAIAHDAGLTL